jgi:hypothetical protein
MIEMINDLMKYPDYLLKENQSYHIIKKIAVKNGNMKMIREEEMREYANIYRCEMQARASRKNDN